MKCLKRVRLNWEKWNPSAWYVSLFIFSRLCWPGGRPNAGKQNMGETRETTEPKNRDLKLHLTGTWYFLSFFFEEMPTFSAMLFWARLGHSLSTAGFGPDALFGVDHMGLQTGLLRFVANTQKTMLFCIFWPPGLGRGRPWGTQGRMPYSPV